MSREISACWASDSHARPGFAEILIALDEVRSAFAATPHESFHTMQDDWRLEIEEVLHGLRMKEKVGGYQIFWHFLLFFPPLKVMSDSLSLSI